MEMQAASSLAPPPRRYADGHKRKPRRRHPGAGTLWRRYRDNWDDLIATGSNPNLGTLTGRMFMFGVITRTEATAAMRYAEVVGRFDRYHAQARRRLASPAYDRGYGREDEVERRTRDGTIREYERRAKRAKKQYSKMVDLIPERERRIFEELVLEDHEISSAHCPMIVRHLRVLCVHFGFREQSDVVPRAKMRVSARDRATVAVRALERWFLGEGTLQTFRLVEEGEQRGILGLGIDKAGKAVRHTVTVKAGKYLREEVDAALLKAAENRGWIEERA